MLVCHPFLSSGALKKHVPLKKGVFLVATPNLMDPNFIHSVVLLIDYGTKGAVGLIINKPAFLLLEEVLPEEDMKGVSLPLYIGGPVNKNTLFLLFTSRKPVEGAHKVLDNIYFSARKDLIFHTIRKKEKTMDLKVFAGYAGWAPGQLEMEIRRGAWITMEADRKTIFSKDPSEIWPSIFEVPSNIMIYNDIYQLREQAQSSQNSLSLASAPVLFWLQKGDILNL